MDIIKFHLAHTVKFENTEYKINAIHELIRKDHFFDYDPYLMWLFPKFTIDAILVDKAELMIFIKSLILLLKG